MPRTELIRPLPELLRSQAASLHDKPAFRDGRRSVGYAELELRTGRLAGHLAALGLDRGGRVAIHLDAGVEVVEAYLAAVRAAGVAVPVNPHSSDEELAHILDDSGAAVVVTDTRHLEQVLRLRADRPGLLVVVSGAAAPDLPSFEELAATEPPVPPRDDLGLDETAFMLYTSGSTGAPKGVLSTQRSCLWSVASCYAPLLGLSRDDLVLWPLPLFHSLAHIVCVVGVTATGATAHIMPGFSADEVLAELRGDAYTFLAGVPALYHHLLREADAGRPDLPRLRVCLSTGAVTSASLARDFEDAFGIPLLNSYGSTETCGAIATEAPGAERVSGSCGLPVPGLEVRVVDPETGIDTDPGTEGEVWVRGPSLMRGYHNRPEATAEALRDGWYRTGDLAVRAAGGQLTISGRRKELIIRGGENIHPGEIEDVVRAVPGVLDVAVAGRPDEVLGEVPVAFVVAAPEGVDAELVFAACAEQLSWFKVPQEVRAIAAVPRTASGKVTRHRLFDQPGTLLGARGVRQESLYRMDWVPLPAGPVEPVRAALLGSRADGADWLDGLDGPDGLAVERYTDLAELTAAGAPEVVYLPWPAADRESGPEPVADAARRTAREAAELLTRWLADDRLRDTRLVVLTRGALAVHPGEEVPGLAQAPLWGLLRAAQTAHPGRFTVADLDGEAASSAALPAGLATGEPQFAVRGGVLRAPRLVPVTAAASGRRLDGTVLVTGADGTAAAAIARRLVAEHGVRHLVLASTTPDSAALAVELSESGAEVTLAACDAADRASVAELLAGVPAEHPLTAVVHAAGSPGLAAGGQADRWVRTGVDGAVVLHELTAGLDLTAFLLVSSTGALRGADEGDHGDHGGCAAFLDALAQHRRATGRHAVSLAWDTTDPGAVSDAELGALLDAALGGADTPVVATRDTTGVLFRDPAAADGAADTVFAARLRALPRAEARQA
ncbi:SDR family NAD(P)-dependent oxidoreductase, partial [Kitasatospora sp. NPDC057512]|uniref:SDR family NAD(P)-dependent oxidoreductase n=1 Tax=Kitasatospora sp. NPDC057512 TaxID=3346154 RepID=UPI0036ACC7A1